MTADGKTRSYESLANTVGEALDDAGIKLDEDDIVTPQKDELLTAIWRSWFRESMSRWKW